MVNDYSVERMRSWFAKNQLVSRISLAYLAVAVWAFGWLAATFGLGPSLFLAAILFAPAFFAWRMAARQQAIQQHEYAYLSIIATVAVAATTFLVIHWYGAGMDSLARFDREFRAFRRHVASTPEYRNVQIEYTHRKGGRVYMHGYVPSKFWHDLLIQDIESMVRSNFSGYFDGVHYPNKPTPTKT
jgi:hypothetical protein